MPGRSDAHLHKMFRWLRDKKKGRHGKKTTQAEDDYGFRKKKQIIVQETENGHSVIIRDNETTLVYPQSFCHFTYRARMPTPVQNVKETSSHIYDEILEVQNTAKRTLEFEVTDNEADIVKDTHRARDSAAVDLRNAIEVGPYLIVPIINSQTDSNTSDVEILRRRCCDNSPLEACTCSLNVQSNDACWSGAIQGQQMGNMDIQKDTKVVLTRCVKSKSAGGTGAIDKTIPMCSSIGDACVEEACSFEVNFRDSESCLPTLCDLNGDGSSCSLTLTETPSSSTTITEPTKETDINESSAIMENEIDEKFQELNKTDETCAEYDLSTSDESEISKTSCMSDYELYLSKIENNLKLKHNVRKIIESIGTIREENVSQCDDVTEIDSMTYVSSLSEYSSAASHISDVSADRSASDDSGGYFDCAEDQPNAKECAKREGRTCLERSLSAPNPNAARHKNSSSFACKRITKDKTQPKRKCSQNPRANSFDSNIYKALSDEDREMYLFPSGKKSDCGSSCSGKSRHIRSKPVLAPQPTPVYMDPYRGKTRNNHNRLLGDLIRMNYDKQLFIH